MSLYITEYYVKLFLEKSLNYKTVIILQVIYSFLRFMGAHTYCIHVNCRRSASLVFFNCNNFSVSLLYKIIIKRGRNPCTGYAYRTPTFSLKLLIINLLGTEIKYLKK